MPQSEVTLLEALGTIAVDEEAYFGCANTYIPSVELVTSWYSRNPAIYTILRDVDTRRVVGYLNAMPVSHGFWKMAMRGELFEERIDETTLLTYDRPGRVNLYLCSLAVMPRYQSTLAVRQIVRGFAEAARKRAQARIFMDAVMVDAVSTVGTRLCEKLGMRVVARTERNTPIYYAHVSSLKILASGHHDSRATEKVPL